MTLIKPDKNHHGFKLFIKELKKIENKIKNEWRDIIVISSYYLLTFIIVIISLTVYDLTMIKEKTLTKENQHESCKIEDSRLTVNTYELSRCSGDSRYVVCSEGILQNSYRHNSSNCIVGDRSMYCW